ncbi:MAG: STAS domain-containing protein [Spirochaetales bacterium]|nr:STAS domain-containing protein [Spirochaetales bacterium]
MTCDISYRDNVIVLALNGHLDLHSAPRLSQEIQDVIREGASKLVIDLAGVTYIDSSGIGVLLKVFGCTRRGEFRLRLCGVDGAVEHVIGLTKLTNYLPISADLSTAIADLDGETAVAT